VNVSETFASKTLINKTGIDFKILNVFQEKINFIYDLVNCNGNWGRLNGLNNWTGIIGMLNKSVSKS